jgi:hypothetical protein
VIPRVHSIRSAITIADAHQVQRKLLADLRLHRIHDRPKWLALETTCDSQESRLT